jgi:hypothetical protein
MLVDDELGELLAAGERAAFHGRPTDGVVPLTEAISRASLSEDVVSVAAATWLLGVCLAASGKYGSAMAALGPLAADSAGAQGGNVFGSLAASTLASVNRQLGRHVEALDIDDYALVIAGDSPEAQFDARLGRAADLVGAGDAAGARGESDKLDDLLAGRADWWRQRVRRDWLTTELALLVDDAEVALEASARAVEAAEVADAPRHVSKGLLFHGVALVKTDDHLKAAEVLRRSAMLADRVGALPLVWAARGVLGALIQHVHPEEAVAAFRSARETIRTIALDLPDSYADDLLRRPDIVALFEAASGP